MKMKTLFATVLIALPLLAADEAPKEMVVDQKDRDFSVKEITVKPGQKVTFKNDDTFAHNAFSSTTGHEFDLDAMNPSESKSISFDTEGDIEVRCAIHPKMKMIIHVKK